MILSLWHEGRIKLTELITKRYTLEEINEGYADLMDGKNIRGVVVHQH
jgi:S-(hydroxymethyl)glutathione dehydrogenase/alcohol dehydrogenase